jgi:hypothetical protein
VFSGRADPASMGSIGAAFDNAMAGSFFATSTPN